MPVSAPKEETVYTVKNIHGYFVASFPHFNGTGSILAYVRISKIDGTGPHCILGRAGYTLGFAMHV